jgi:hypothetical protein
MQTICALSLELQPPLVERFAEVVQTSAGIGWCYHDDLKEIYAGAFPDHV